MTKAVKKTTKRAPRLFTNAVFVGHTRSLANQKNKGHLIQIEGCKDTKAARFYQGKRVAYFYQVKGGKARVIWGKITRPHGSNGHVRALFNKNLPGQAMAKTLRVMLYPSSI